MPGSALKDTLPSFLDKINWGSGGVDSRSFNPSTQAGTTLGETREPPLSL